MTYRNLFTIAYALNEMDATILSKATTADMDLTGAAMELDDRFQEFTETLESITRNDRKKMHYESKRAQVAVELTMKYLLPAMLELDPNLDRVFNHFTGSTLHSAMGKLRFETGDHGGWYGLVAHYGKLEITITDSTPCYPRVTDCEISLTPTDQPDSPGYVLVVLEGTVTVDATRSLDELLRDTPNVVPASPEVHTDGVSPK